MTIFEKDDINNYKRWAILQKLNELKKKLKRAWTQDDQDRYDDLQKDLNNYG